jgi:poly-beta-1,6-N-acetyl-D-glucosamine synthase
LVPCYNEEDTIENTVEQLRLLNYPNYEIIAINDGSKDNT